MRCFIPILFCAALPAVAAEIPHLQRQGTATELIVDGKPFVLLSGELHNSSASSLDYMKPIWPKLVKMNLNSAIATVSWELLEPEEGHFDFRLVDGLLVQARQNRMKLVLIWFGTWKNGVSSYAPLWVKSDLKRFPRAQNKPGRNSETISPFCEAARDADARAFRALMKHLKAVDSVDRTVVMMQVENEVGFKNTPRDMSALGDRAFSEPVPAALMERLNAHKDRVLPETKAIWASTGYRSSGTWAEVFGASPWAEEACMAWHYARYVSYVAAQGKAEYPLPMYANAWLQGDNQQPGIYPSGGPVARVMEIWKAGAPALDLIAPDIYLPDFASITAQFTRMENPLFIPEAGHGSDGAAKAFYAIGEHSAIGFSPFGIDSVEDGQPLAGSYRVLGGLMPEVIRNYGKDSMKGILEYKEDAKTIDLGGYRLNIGFKIREKKGLGYGLVIATGPDEFLFAGSNYTVTFGANSTEKPVASIASVDEMALRDGKWVAMRRLNGDETAGGWQVKMPVDAVGVQRVKLYRHE
jgi:hypothetical protein